MGGEKLRVPEAPAHREAGQPGVGGGLDVHIGVAHIDGPAGSGAQLLQRAEYRVRRGLAGYPLGFADGHRDARPKIGMAQALYRTVEFVGHHGSADTGLPQTVQQGQNAGVGGGFMLHIQGIVGAEVGQDAGFHLLGRPLGHGPVDEAPHAVAHEAANLLQRSGGHPLKRQSVIGAVGQILKGVQKRAV